MELITLISVSLLASIIGAMPLGLVNLTVLEVSYRKGLPTAMKIAGGASLVEILFVLVALMAGSIISTAIKNMGWVQWLFVAVPVFTGIYFLIVKNHFEADQDRNRNEFVRGAFLNLISLQVLLYWIFAATLINHNQYTKMGLFTIFIVVLSVCFGKMLVLWVYAKLSKIVLEKFQFFSIQISRLIGIILILIGFSQYLKF